ncbi:hypothetical protein SAMN05444406_10361 [Caldicoprobacter faecalis]|uniref:Uncharacterized protein n=1 Tax=Caldicoprobacter faecalis TaxID=937334 RepID=A0A1I5SV67_9FIRM|nr:hypothetical protein SAMN05444406_10361 [Caldicoprobacter faecalis]
MYLWLVFDFQTKQENIKQEFIHKQYSFYLHSVLKIIK